MLKMTTNFFTSTESLLIRRMSGKNGIRERLTDKSRGKLCIICFAEKNINADNHRTNFQNTNADQIMQLNAVKA